MEKIVKYCLVTFYLCLSSSLFAQSFISEGKLWRYGHKVYVEPCCILANTALKFKGDSIINDTTYIKLYRSEDESLLKWNLYGLWRETMDKKIFSRDLFHQTEKLLYNFSFVKGDTIDAGFATFKVDSVLAKMWGGKIRKHWYLNPIHAAADSVNEFYSTLWVEDVGQIDFFPHNTSGDTGATSYLLCFTEDGQMVYQNPLYNTCVYTSTENISNQNKEFKVYPNPVSKELFVEGNFYEKDYSLEMYSINGEMVKTECLESGSHLNRIDMSFLRNGIYVLRLISTSGKFIEEVIIKN